MCSNFNTRVHDVKLRDMLYRAGSAHQKRKFNETLKSLFELLPPDERGRLNPGWKWIQDNPLHTVDKWTLSHDDGRRWGVLTTNNSECFNNVLKGARNLSPTACVQLTFYQMVKYFNQYRTLAELDARNNHMIPRQVHNKIFGYQSKGNSYQVVAYDW